MCRTRGPQVILDNDDSLFSQIQLPPDSSGGATTLANGETRVYYQTKQGAIRELAGTGPPQPGRYIDTVILPNGSARRGAGLAVTNIDPKLGFQLVSSHSPTLCLFHLFSLICYPHEYMNDDLLIRT